MLEDCITLPFNTRMENSKTHSFPKTLHRITVIQQTLLKGGACNDIQRDLAKDYNARCAFVHFEIMKLINELNIIFCVNVLSQRDQSNTLKYIRVNYLHEEQHISEDVPKSLLNQQSNQTQETSALLLLFAYHLIHYRTAMQMLQLWLSK